MTNQLKATHSGHKGCPHRALPSPYRDSVIKLYFKPREPLVFVETLCFKV